jgi:hypothetical protein
LIPHLLPIGDLALYGAAGILDESCVAAVHQPRSKDQHTPYRCQDLAGVLACPQVAGLLVDEETTAEEPSSLGFEEADVIGGMPGGGNNEEAAG